MMDALLIGRDALWQDAGGPAIRIVVRVSCKRSVDAIVHDRWESNSAVVSDSIDADETSERSHSDHSKWRDDTTCEDSW
jgi:hypothetical protein